MSENDKPWKNRKSASTQKPTPQPVKKTCPFTILPPPDLPSYPHLAGFSHIFLALPYPTRIFEICLLSCIFWNMLQFFPKKLIFPQNLYFLIKPIQEVILSPFLPSYPVLSPDRWSIDLHIQIVWTIKTTLSQKTGQRVFI